MPEVTVIVPAYNAEPFIAATLDSALAQTWQDFEIIVVDDGSRDRTSDIVRRYAAGDHRIRLIQQKNAGASAARNTAIEHARGEFIAPLDADDIWHPTKLERQLEVFRHSSERVGVVYTWYLCIDERNRPTGGWDKFVDEGDLYLKLCLQLPLLHSACMFRRSCFTTDRPYDESVPALEDLQMNLQLAERYDFAVAPEFLTFYRVHGDSLTHKYKTMLAGFSEIIEAVRASHPEIPGFVFRWSYSIVYAWLAVRSLRARDFPTTAAYLARATLNDWSAPIRIAGMLARKARLGRPASAGSVPDGGSRRRLAAPEIVADPLYREAVRAPTSKLRLGPLTDRRLEALDRIAVKRIGTASASGRGTEPVQAAPTGTGAP